MKFCILVCAFCLLTSVAFALPEPGFDPKDVVRQVRSAHSTPGPLESLNPALDDGEFLIDTSGVRTENSPAVAFDGTNFLVVWVDYRSYPDTSDTYGARVTQAGVVLDTAGIAISTAAYVQWYPAVGFDGSNFLVVWMDRRRGSNYYDIYGARVTKAGLVLDTAGIAISTAAYAQALPALAFDGTNFLVVWEDNRISGLDICATRVTPAGVVLDPSGFVISQAADDQEYPALAFDGTNFLVAWTDCRNNPDTSDIFGARVTQGGVVLDTAGIAISTATNRQWYPALAFDGENFLVAWTDCRNNPDTSGIFGARVTPAGVVLDTAGIPVSTAANGQSGPALAFDGTNFLVVWMDYRNGYDIYGARVTPAGVVFDSGPVVRQEGYQDSPALARGTGSQMFLVYQGWADTVGGKAYNTWRIWGKMDPSPAVAEIPKPEVRVTNSGATVVCGVLHLPASPSGRPQTSSWLLDISGRKLIDLHPGANDVTALAVGVYFVRSAVRVRKVILEK